MSRPNLPLSLRRRLRNSARSSRVLRWLCRHNLSLLAKLHRTDKWGPHWYAQHYQRHFKHLRKRRLRLLEIGVGGFEDPRAGGASLRMWKDYFPRGHIYGIDAFEKSALEEPRIRIFQGRQADPEFLRQVIRNTGPLDIVIDDGSHINDDVVTSFFDLFPFVANNGFYAIEDLQTSYWPEFGGTEEPHCSHTSMAMCKRLIDGLNWEEFEEREPSEIDRNIVGLHFYHNLVIIQKGRNEEGTNKRGRHAVFRETKHVVVR